MLHIDCFHIFFLYYVGLMLQALAQMFQEQERQLVEMRTMERDLREERRLLELELLNEVQMGIVLFSLLLIWIIPLIDFYAADSSSASAVGNSVCQHLNCNCFAAFGYMIYS